MNIIHVVRDLAIASGGPSRSVPALAVHQSQHSDVHVKVVFSGGTNSPTVDLSAETVAYVRTSGSRASLRADMKHSEDCVVHLHGLWSPILHFAARHARGQNIPYVISPRGMLANWALGHKAIKKQLAWRFYQRQDLRNADCLLPSSAFERNDVLKLMPGLRCEILPNGCELRPEEIVSATTPLLHDDDARWALAIGRIHPVKGFAELITAWSETAPKGWKLAIAGPDEGGYLAQLKSLVNSLGLEQTVVFTGAVDDNGKWSLLERCELFIAPSKTENFGMAIAEALQSGTPVITTTGTPWDMLPGLNCGWWVAPESAALKVALGQATVLPASVLSAMGDRGHRLINEQFGWKSVAKKSLEIYQSILQRKHVATSQ